MRLRISHVAASGLASVLLAAPGLLSAQATLPDWSVVGHAQPLATLSYVDPSGALDPRIWSLGADGLVVTWDSASWSPLAWRRFDEARAIGGLYEGDVVVETPAGVLRVEPGTLLDSTATPAYPDAMLPSPAGLNEQAGTHVVVPPARTAFAVVSTEHGIALLEAAAWCTVTAESMLDVRCFADPSQRVLGALGQTVMTCTRRGDQAMVRVRSLTDGATITEQEAAGCPDAAYASAHIVTATDGDVIYDWDGTTLQSTPVRGVVSATTPVGWSRERLALVERFDGTCAGQRRILLRHGLFGEQTVWRGECEGDERLLPVATADADDDASAVVRPAGDGVFVEIYQRNGQRSGRFTLESLPTAAARLVHSDDGLRVIDPAAATDERVEVGTAGSAILVRSGAALVVERTGQIVGSITLLGSDAVVAAPGSIAATPGIANRLAIRTDAGPSLLPVSGYSARSAEQLIRSLASPAPR